MKPTVEKVDNEAKAMEKGKYQSTLRSKPYMVTKVKVKQVTERRDGKERIRNKTKAKLVKERPIPPQTSTNRNRKQAEDSNDEPSPSPQKYQVFCKDPKDPFPPEQIQRMMQSMEILLKKVIEQHFKKMME